MSTEASQVAKDTAFGQVQRCLRALQRGIPVALRNVCEVTVKKGNQRVTCDDN